MNFAYLLTFRLLSYAYEEQRKKKSQTKFLSQYRQKGFLKLHTFVPVTLQIALDLMVRNKVV